jgi:hypothetical protein
MRCDTNGWRRSARHLKGRPGEGERKDEVGWSVEGSIRIHRHRAPQSSFHRGQPGGDARVRESVSGDQCGRSTGASPVASSKLVSANGATSWELALKGRDNFPHHLAIPGFSGLTFLNPSRQAVRSPAHRRQRIPPSLSCSAHFGFRSGAAGLEVSAKDLGDADRIKPSLTNTTLAIS